MLVSITPLMLIKSVIQSTVYHFAGFRSDGNANTRQSAVVTGNQDPVPPPQTPHTDNYDGFSDDEFADGGTCTAVYAYEGTSWKTYVYI